MHDFYTVLEKVIAETRNNPAQMRQVIYECARLAAKRQALLQSPALTLLQVQERMLALEQAIARIEATALQEDAGKLVVDNSPQGTEYIPLVEGPERFAQPADHARHANVYDEAPASGTDNAMENPGLPLRPAAIAPRLSNRRDTEPDRALTFPSRPVECSVLRESAAVESVSTFRDIRPALRDVSRALSDGVPAFRDIGRTPDDFKRSLGMSAVRIAKTAVDYGFRVRNDSTAILGNALPSIGRLVQFVIAGLIAVAIYSAFSSRETAPPTAAVPARPAEQASTASTGDGALIAGGAPLAAPAFPLPSIYGVYAVSNGQLVELEQVQATPVDPRTRTVLQITTPSRAVLPSGAPVFLVYRRDLLTSAPEKVGMRIAARIARMMTFDSTGKAVTAPPATDSWLVRDAGHELRVRPLRENQEMILVQSDDPTFTLPAGRYVLLFGGNSYDFTIEGPVTNPAHCVESVATTRGPTFYECRAD